MSPSSKPQSLSSNDRKAARSLVTKTQKALLALLEWQPNMAAEGPGASDSTSTHPPNEYALHLNSEQRLKSIVHVPSISSVIAQLAIHATKSAGDLPDVCQKSDALGDILKNVRRLNVNTPKMLNEKSVEDAYQRIAEKLLPVAVTLKYKSSSWSPGGFQWALDHSRNQLAMGDGFLRMEERDDHDNEDLTSMFKFFRELAIWEFKTMRVVSDDVMHAIQDLAHQPSFHWVSCEHVKCGQSIHRSTLDPGKPEITGSREGFDASDGVSFNVRSTPCSCKHHRLPKQRTKTARRNAMNIVEQVRYAHVTFDIALADIPSSSCGLKQYISTARL